MIEKRDELRKETKDEAFDYCRKPIKRHEILFWFYPKVLVCLMNTNVKVNLVLVLISLKIVHFKATNYKIGDSP